MRPILIACALGLGLAGACASVPGEPAAPARPDAPTVRAWFSSADQTFLLAEQAPLAWEPAGPGAVGGERVLVRAGRQRQTIDGFGASMTDAAAWCLSRLPEAERRALMRELFDPDQGLGLSLLRQPMGAPDFARRIYSYDDLAPGESDFGLERFSIAADEECIIPALQEALAINPGLRIIASPWSPPAWMKTGADMKGAAGGVLREDCYESYAQYFVRFIQAYAAKGIPIWAVTPQNEMDYAPAEYPGMKWSTREASRFVGDYLVPALRRAGLDTLVMAWDHNWDRADLARELLLADRGKGALAGSAWHWYGGGPQAMSAIHDEFPGYGIWFTEGGNGNWIGSGSFMSNFKDGMGKLMGIMGHWSRSFIMWNIALDQRNGPIVFKNTANHGLVEIDTEAGRLVRPYRSGWYLLGHFSRFLGAGDRVLETASEASGLLALAFERQDGRVLVVLANRYSSDQSARVELEGPDGRPRGGFTISVPGEGLASCLLPPLAALR